MELKKLLLKKGEVPIDKINSRLSIPIHPKLRSNEVHIDKELASRVFPIALDNFMCLPEVKNEDYSAIKRSKSDGNYFFENGLSKGLTVAQGLGLYFTDRLHFHPHCIKFSKEKMQEYCTSYYEDSNTGIGFAYYSRDVGMPVLKLYQDWAILYLNEALKQAFK